MDTQSNKSYTSAAARAAAEEEAEVQAYIAKCRAKYTSILDPNEKKHTSKVVGLNPNMVPTYS